MRIRRIIDYPRLKRLPSRTELLIINYINPRFTARGLYHGVSNEDKKLNLINVVQINVTIDIDPMGDITEEMRVLDERKMLECGLDRKVTLQSQGHDLSLELKGFPSTTYRIYQIKR